MDLALLLLSFTAFWALFSVLGGEVTFSRMTATITATTFGLLYAQYFALFSYFGGATPGMMLFHLRVASLDGGPPSRHQLVWRSIGYLISAGTAFLGFLWALWDEDHLTWQDRISQTYLVATDALKAPVPGAANAGATVLR